MEEYWSQLLLALSAIIMVHGDPSHCPDWPEPVKEVDHPCKRECIAGQSMTCRYHFQVEQYYSMSKACYDCPANIKDCYRKDCVAVDGYSKVLYTVNRQLPGPTIEVCKGDKIEVTIENKMHDETTSIHWHGMLQEGTPYMDGVPFVTQCPIGPGSKFEVKFWAADSGTHFWHGHTEKYDAGIQRLDGLYGAIIVHEPMEDTIHAELYDEDKHVMIVNDWAHSSGDEMLMAYLHRGGTNAGDTILCNGRGRYYNDSTLVTYTPTDGIVVEQGKSYRLRLIHAGGYDCPMEVWFDNHTITTIACDGSEIEPVETDSLVISAGERFDIVLNADQPVDNYWMRLTGLMLCEDTKAHTVIPIHYKGASCQEPTSAVGYNIHPLPKLELNALNVGRNTSGAINIVDLYAHVDRIKNESGILKDKADLQIWLSFTFNALDNPAMHKKDLYGFYQVNSSMQVHTPQINQVSLKMPNAPLLSQSCDIDPSNYCNEDTHTNCTEEYCECTVIHHVPLGAICEIILIDNGETFTANHPFHLHGNSFRVVSMEKFGSNQVSTKLVQDLDKAGKLLRNLNNPPYKDTVSVPEGGATILRFHANNPGYWLLHCHLELHFELKMGVIIKVGEEEDLPPIPNGFPMCGKVYTNNKGKTCRNNKRNYFIPNVYYKNEKIQVLTKKVEQISNKTFSKFLNLIDRSFLTKE